MNPFYQEERLGDTLLPAKMLRGSVVAGRIVAPHWHDFLEILYLLDGQVELQLNTARHTVATGDAILLNSMDIHALAGEASFLVLEMEPGLTGDIRVPLRRIFPSDDCAKVIHARDGGSAGLLGTLAIQMPAIAEAFDRRVPGYELDIRGRIYQIIASLVRHAGSWPGAADPDDGAVSAGDVRRREIARLDDLLAYLREHCQERLTSREAARLLNYDESYFCRFFKRLTGMPFQRYLTLYRCARAEELLRGTRLPVSQIAQRTGFSSGSHLSASYRRCMGVTPAETRAGRD